MLITTSYLFALIASHMFHGGSTFGLWNGAYQPPYVAEVSSHDYNAPIAEDGQATELYEVLKERLLDVGGSRKDNLLGWLCLKIQHII